MATAANPPFDQLYLLQNGQQVGPFPAAAVRAMLDSGSVSPEDLAWYESLPEWRSLASLFPGVRAGHSPVAPGVASEAYPQEETFGSLLMDAFSYPFRGDGMLILALGAVFFSILGALGSVGGLLIRGSVLLQLFYYGYLASMLQQVLHGSGEGESVLPKWPEFTDWQSDIIEPAMKWIGTFLLVLGPGIGCIFIGMASGVGPIPGVLLLFLGLFYMPMAFMLVGMFDTLLALNPVVGFRSIFAIFGHYLATCLVLGLLLGMNILTGSVGDMVSGIPLTLIAGLIDGFNRLYTLVLFARILGCLYRVNKRRLGWF